MTEKDKNEQKEKRKEDIANTIEKLKEMKEKGSIAEKDFERTKEGLLKKMK